LFSLFAYLFHSRPISSPTYLQPLFSYFFSF
jgi:hypothetical protein